MLAFAGHFHVDQFRTSVEQDAYPRRISGLNRLSEARDIHTVDERLEFGPTRVTIGARQHALGVVKRECRWIGPPLIPVSYTHLRAHETDSYLVCRLLLEKKK